MTRGAVHEGVGAQPSEQRKTAEKAAKTARAVKTTKGKKTVTA